MREAFLKDDVWRSPISDIKVTERDGERIIRGSFRLAGQEIGIKNGAPFFVRDEGDSGAEQVRSVFSEYWKTHRLDESPRGKVAMYSDGFRKLMMVDTPDIEDAHREISSYLSKKKRILDAGCGPGWAASLYRANAEQKWYSVDFGESAYLASKNLSNQQNSLVVRASLFELPFKEKFFDLIISNGVLHHTPDPRGGFRALVRHLAPGGEISIGMIRKQTPLRDLADKVIREKVTKLPLVEALEFGGRISALGKALQSIKGMVKVPAGLEVIGLEEGEYTVHRLIHTHFMKCFHSADLSEEENRMQSVDWYAVAYAWPHTEEELTNWYREEGLTNIRLWQPRSKSDKHEMIRITGTRPS